MIAQRIELAKSKTGDQVAGVLEETNLERRQVLDDCGMNIARAIGHLRLLRAADALMWDEAQRDMNDVWRHMEMAVRRVTGESPVTLVAPPTMPSLAAPLTN
jgi:hypothetical protein